MPLPDAATRAALRIAAQAQDARDAVRTIRDDPEGAIATVPVMPRDPLAPGLPSDFDSLRWMIDFGPLFDQARSFPWSDLDPSYADPPFQFLRVPLGESEPRVQFGCPVSQSEPLELRDSAGNATKDAIAVVEAWAVAFIELAEQLVGVDLPELEELDLPAKPAALYRVLRPRFGRRQGLTPTAVHEKAEANGDNFFFVDTSEISRAKAALNEALKPYGVKVTYRPTRGGYFLERMG